jgi:predicted signal transduction protein with EAL and GGDEF domain
VADRLREVSRSSDTVARLGGDEFAVLLPDVADEGAALLLAGRCLTALHTAFDVEGVALNVEASIGLALSPQHGLDGNTLLRAADVAMYKAKERKSGIVVYDADLDVDTPTRLAVMGDLRRALQDGELFMHYQPKVTLSTQQVHSVEALVRWQHPTRGVVQPAEFIAMAEGTGLILPLTMHTLDLAVAQARQWMERDGEIQVAVNLSARCLLELNLPSLVQGVLDRHGLPARLLRLEITESTFMAEPARALTILHGLHQSGVSLSIDDFGTGYASMSYLKRLPVEELKVDRSFISHLLDNGSDSVLVRSSIDLGHNLGLSVVAEGVEDLSTLAELASLGCDVAQGYYLSRPVSAAAFDQWRADWRGIPGLPAPLDGSRPDSPAPHPTRT